MSRRPTVAELQAEVERLQACNAMLMQDGRSALAVGVEVLGNAHIRVVVTDPAGDKAREMEVAIATYRALFSGDEAVLKATMTAAGFTP